MLKANIQERKKLALSITETHTKESVENIAKATTHGDNLLVIGGRHYTHDDDLKPAEIEAKNRDVNMMKEEKTKRLGQENTEKEASAIIELELLIDAMTNTNFTKLLLWYVRVIFGSSLLSLTSHTTMD